MFAQVPQQRTEVLTCSASTMIGPSRIRPGKIFGQSPRAKVTKVSEVGLLPAYVGSSLTEFQGEREEIFVADHAILGPQIEHRKHFQKGRATRRRVGNVQTQEPSKVVQTNQISACWAKWLNFGIRSYPR